MERSSVDNIYAIGDVLEGVPELMPVAQKGGKRIAHRIHERMNGDKTEEEILKKHGTDYSNIPTTIFSPSEYSFVGLNEEEALKEHGDEDIEVYHREVTPLELSIVKGNLKSSYMKLICLKSQNEKIIGMHYLGPAADEVIAGYAVAMKLGLRKEHLDDSIGIHPSTSEEFFNMEITKRSKEDYSKTEC
jgi:thioredoxin reductase (NADPH)